MFPNFSYIFPLPPCLFIHHSYTGLPSCPFTNLFHSRDAEENLLNNLWNIMSLSIFGLPRSVQNSSFDILQFFLLLYIPFWQNPIWTHHFKRQVMNWWNITLLSSKLSHCFVFISFRYSTSFVLYCLIQFASSRFLLASYILYPIVIFIALRFKIKFLAIYW
jgi:hypothetical protein